MEHMGTVHGRLPDSEAPAVPSPAAVRSPTKAVALRKKRKRRGQMAAFFMENAFSIFVRDFRDFPRLFMVEIGEYRGIHDSNSQNWDV